MDRLLFLTLGRTQKRSSIPSLFLQLHPHNLWHGSMARYPVKPRWETLLMGQSIKEIQLKTNESRPISRFFSKKGARSQQESKLLCGTTTEEVTEINPPEIL